MAITGTFGNVGFLCGETNMTWDHRTHDSKGNV
jgi:hypothetical protein